MRSVLPVAITAFVILLGAGSGQADEPTDDEMISACETYAKSELKLTDETVEAGISSKSAPLGFSMLVVDVFGSGGQTGYYCMFDETSYEAVRLEKR